MTERMGLIHRMEDLRRLFELTTDSQARTAINAEIAKRESLIAEIDNKAPEKLPADQCGAHMAELADIFARKPAGDMDGIPFRLPTKSRAEFLSLYCRMTNLRARGCRHLPVIRPKAWEPQGLSAVEPPL
jgi:hypothetical protein